MISINKQSEKENKDALEEQEKLKKQIKSLQEEIEDKEDDLAMYRKKMKKKEEENDDLQKQLNKEKKDSRKWHEDLEQTKSELEKQSDALNLKVKALSFVQEILSAEPEGDVRIRKLYSKVDSFCDFVRDELKECIVHLFKPNKEIYNEKIENVFFKDGLERWAATMKKEWIRERRTIAFVGEFSAGKTSIVNRILSQDDPDVPLLPVSAKATTAIPTYIVGYKDTYYHFVAPDDTYKKSLKILSNG